MLCRLLSRPLIYRIKYRPPTLRKRGTFFHLRFDIYQKRKEDGKKQIDGMMEYKKFRPAVELRGEVRIMDDGHEGSY